MVEAEKPASLQLAEAATFSTRNAHSQLCSPCGYMPFTRVRKSKQDSRTLIASIKQSFLELYNTP